MDLRAIPRTAARVGTNAKVGGTARQRITTARDSTNANGKGVAWTSTAVGSRHQRIPVQTQTRTSAGAPTTTAQREKRRHLEHRPTLPATLLSPQSRCVSRCRRATAAPIRHARPTSRPTGARRCLRLPPRAAPPCPESGCRAALADTPAMRPTARSVSASTPRSSTSTSAASIKPTLEGVVMIARRGLELDAGWATAAHAATSSTGSPL